MSMKQTSKRELIIIKCVEPAGWELDSPCLSGGIPPFGTVNVNAVKTGEDISSGDPVTDWDSVPERGGFEILVGKTSLSFKTEPDKIDSQDISGIPKGFIRGFDTYSGQFEFEQLKNSQRIQGAVDGHWDPNGLTYSPYMDFRLYEIWTILNPVDANGDCDMSLNALSCDMLMKHYEVVMDSLDESRDIPNKLTVPISRRWYQRFKNVTFETTHEACFTGAAVAAGTYTDDSAGTISVFQNPREHTRLRLNCTVGAAGLITVYGNNIFGEPVQEVFDLADLDANDDVIGHTYFKTMHTIVTSVGSLTFTINDYDYKLKNPAF